MYQRLTLLHTRSIDWFKQRAHGAYAKAWLFFLSFTESSFLFIPPDILLIAILLAGSRQWMYYGLLTSVASILGAVFGYVVALFFYDTLGIHIVDFYHLKEEVVLAQTLFNNNAFWVIFTAAFTPIPYKVFVLAAGFLKVNFFVFLVASIIGRSLRYIIIAYVVHLLGERAVKLLSRYSIALTIAVVVIVTVFIVKQII
ncbi:MAG: VTT domain-containing protein [Candidatus Pacebacteria bacterium]|nr:VTT domain-containing protein [Candidatus Paceibacterota bacterium]